MLHTWDSGNYFFERPTDSSGADTPAPPRPPAGYSVLVQDADDGSALPNLFTDPGGHWSYSADKDAAKMGIRFSADGGATWSTVLWSQQSFSNAMSAGATSAQALAQVQALDGRVDALASQIDDSVAGVSRIVTPESPDGLSGAVTLTPDELGARSKSEKVPAADVDGLKPIATSGLISSAEGYVAPIPLAQKGQANGVPSLDGNGKLRTEFLPGGYGATGSVAGVVPDANADIPKADLLAALGAATKTDLNAYAKTADLATVATSNSFNDLDDKPVMASGMLLCDPATGVWPTRPNVPEPQWWNSVERSKATGADVVPPSGVGGARDGDGRLTWSE